MNEFPHLVDSHLHLLSLEAKGVVPEAALAELFDAGARWALDVAVDTDGWARRLAWADAEPRLGLTAGIHPSEAPSVTGAHRDLLEAQLAHPRVWAVGEIGLDWYRGREAEAAQRELFRWQLGLAGARNLPVVIHNRQADQELLEDLDAVAWSGRGIQHCFSSDRAFARQALDRGFYLSFAGNLTYPSAQNLRDVAAWAPLDRLLVETDSPYLAPQGHRGEANRPLWAGLTARRLAEVRGLAVEAILEATAANFERLFGLTDRG